MPGTNSFIYALHSYIDACCHPVLAPPSPPRAQTEILVLSEFDLPGGTTPSPVLAPTPAPASSTVVEIGTVSTASVTATLYDPSLLEENGCDPSGCTATLTRVRFSRGLRVLLALETSNHVCMCRWESGHSRCNEAFVRSRSTLQEPGNLGQHLRFFPRSW